MLGRFALAGYAFSAASSDCDARLATMKSWLALPTLASFAASTQLVLGGWT